MDIEDLHKLGKKHNKMMEGLTASLGSRDAWCHNDNGANPLIMNDWNMFQAGITNFTLGWARAVE